MVDGVIKDTYINIAHYTALNPQFSDCMNGLKTRAQFHEDLIAFRGATKMQLDLLNPMIHKYDKFYTGLVVLNNKKLFAIEKDFKEHLNELQAFLELIIPVFTKLIVLIRQPITDKKKEKQLNEMIEKYLNFIDSKNKNVRSSLKVFLNKY